MNAARIFIGTLVQYKLSRFFTFQLKKNEVLKTQAKLPNLKLGIVHALNILNIFNDNNLWLDEDIVNFFEVSNFL